VALDHSVALREFAEARGLRPDAYAKCGDRPELRARDQRLVDGEAELRRLIARSAAQRARLEDVVHASLDFLAAQRAAPEHASNAPRCEALPTPQGASPETTRWCTARRQLGESVPLELRYAETSPQAFRFSVAVDGPLDCAAVVGTELRRWQVTLPGGARVTRARCALTGRLAGLVAIVSGGEASTLYVVSPSYLELDPSARSILDP
jgi:hypothetical protein